MCVIAGYASGMREKLLEQLPSSHPRRIACCPAPDRHQQPRHYMPYAAIT